MIHSRAENQNGFTLIELLIVTAIIGLLATLTISYYTQYKERAYDVEAKSNLKSLWLTCNLYWHDNKSTSTCTIAAVSTTSYGFETASDVTLSGQGTETTFSGTASHIESPTTFAINAAGNLS